MDTEELRAYGRALAEGEPPLTEEQVMAAARILSTVQTGGRRV